MNIFSFMKKKCGVGLDIGKNWTKVVELKKKGGKIQLNKMGRAFLEREESEDKKKTGEKINKLLNSLGIKNKNVNLSLAGHSVIIKKITLPPNMPKKEYEEIIKKQAKEHIPFDIENVYMDWFLIEDVDEKKKECLLVASKKDVVKALTDFIEGIGLNIEVIDVEGFALCNCFEFNYPEYMDKNTYLLDIGSENTIFCVYTKGTPLLIRDLSIGGNQLTNQIKEVLNKNFSESEKIKINMFHDVSPKDRILINQKIEDVYLKWIDEIQKMIFFHISNHPESKEVENIFISGGGSLSPNIKKVLEEHLEKTVEYINPFRKIDISLNNFDKEYIKSIGVQFVVSTGLALRDFIL